MKTKKELTQTKNRFTIDDLSAIFDKLVKISSEEN